MKLDVIPKDVMFYLFQKFRRIDEFDVEEKRFKVLRRDNFSYECYKQYALSYIAGMLTRVRKIGFPATFDDSLTPICLWEELFEEELDKLSKCALTLSTKRKNELNVFDVMTMMLNNFLDYIYEEVEVWMDESAYKR